MNYTRPNDPDHKDSPSDHLFGAQVFSRALAMMLREGQGIVIDLTEAMTFPQYPDAKKVLVYYLNNMVHIEPTEEDWEEGDSLNVLDFNNN